MLTTVEGPAKSSLQRGDIKIKVQLLASIGTRCSEIHENTPQNLGAERQMGFVCGV